MYDGTTAAKAAAEHGITHPENIAFLQRQEGLARPETLMSASLDMLGGETTAAQAAVKYGITHPEDIAHLKTLEGRAGVPSR